MISEKDQFKFPIDFDQQGIRTNGFAFIALLILLICIYAVSFHSPWQYDDFLNIVNNTNIRFEDLSWESILKSFRGIKKHGESLTRPLAFFSFGVNYYFNKYDVFGYHLVNFSIHFSASVFLYLLAKTSLQLPSEQGRYAKSAAAIALLTVFLWAPHPIQVTAVTYIVQRMASMAAMFYIMAIYFFVKARTVSKGSVSLLYWAGTVLAGICAMASKENAVMLPMTLFLLEIMVLQPTGQSGGKRNWIIAIFVLGLMFCLSFDHLSWTRIRHSYVGRPFTLEERLLTEPRVIVFYLSLLFYPTTSRLTLLHDLPLSTGWVAPWSTLPSIALISAIVGIAFWGRRRRPFLAFCIIFFFLNHLIEGSVISLELVYEHRNYLPSMLLFVPVAAVIIRIIDHFAYHPPLQGLVSLCVAVILSAHAYTTFCYNARFNDNLSFWRDNVAKSPKLSIVHNNYGQALWAHGHPYQAKAEFERALELDRFQSRWQRGAILYNLGLHYAYEEKAYSQALALFEQAREVMPAYVDIIRHAALVSLLAGRIDHAEKLLRQGLQLRPTDPGLDQALGIFYLVKKQPRQAFKAAAKTVLKTADLPLTWFIMATASRRSDENRMAKSYLEKILRIDPTNALALFSLVDVSNELHEVKARDRYMGVLSYLKKEQSWQEFWREINAQAANCFFMPSFRRIDRITGEVCDGNKMLR